MKWMLIFSIGWLLCSPSFAEDEIKIQKPTKRMIEISQKYHIMPLLIIPASAENKGEWWEFLGKAPSYKFHVIPVLVKKNASDTDVESAITQAEFCASFYDHMIEKEKAQERPKDQQGI